MIRSFILLLMVETLKVSPLLILSIRDLVWFCCASSDSRSFQTAYILCNTGASNVRGLDVGGPDVPNPLIYLVNTYYIIYIY